MSERETNPAQPLIEPLTRREREILALLAEGLTSPEIADRLTLATSSVKSHVQHLYGKLQASSKREAVARARELGLLAALAPAAGAGPAPAAHPGERLPVTQPPTGLGQPYPTGTLTFLFADIEGLPHLRPVQPEAFKTAPARPAAVLRQAIERHGGYVFRAWGDQVCAAFATAAQAVSAAVAAQRALRSAEVEAAPARMALQTGAAELQDDGDYDGYTLDRAARLLAAANGGQVLIAAATQALLPEPLPDGASLRDLGEHWLKNQVRAEHIFQLAAPGLPDTFPPLATPDSTPHNLPLQLTSFIGRARELAEVARRLLGTRLLTLTGPGGTGKTRLALQVAAALLADFPHGAWLVELAPIAQPSLVPQAVAQALGLRSEPGRPAEQSLAEHLRDKTLLLLLDNCEHLVAACAQLAQALLPAAPGLRILATSREALGLAGESIYPLAPLSVVDPGQMPSLEAISHSEAVALFAERATAVRPDFALSEANAHTVAQICRRLDGIPLAIELAAVRVQALSVEQIAARLDDRFRLLAGGSRSAPARQQTLRATMDWSYELLPVAERVLLQRLSVFAGGWTLEAAEQMAGEAPDTLDNLSRLVGKSLVHSEQRPGQETRFGMLETIREYAQGKLAEAGEAQAARDRHLACYLALAEEAEPGLQRHGQLSWLKRLDRESDNLRAALTWALQTEAAEPALRLASALWFFWYIRGHETEYSRWVEAALGLPASRGALAHSGWRAKALVRAGAMGWASQLEDGGRSRLEEGLAIYRELDNKMGMATALMHMSENQAPDGTLALRLCEQALELFTAAGDQIGIGNCHYHIGSWHDMRGERAQAVQLYQRSLAIFHAEGDRWNQLGALHALAWQTWLDGEAARARALFEENMAAREELGDKGGVYFPLQQLCDMAMAQGRFAEARDAARAIQKIRPGRARDIAVSLIKLGQADYVEGRLDDAQDHFEASLKRFRGLNDRSGMGWVPPWLGCVAYRQGNLDEARALVESGLALSDPDEFWPELAFALLSLGEVTRAQGELARSAALYARSLRMVVAHGAQPDVPAHLEGFAKLALAAGDALRAARLWGAAEALRARIGIPVPPVERADYERAVAAAREPREPDGFTAAWAEGRAWTWEQAAEYALSLTPAPPGPP